MIQVKTGNYPHKNPLPHNPMKSSRTLNLEVARSRLIWNGESHLPFLSTKPNGMVPRPAKLAWVPYLVLV